jgi:hypothetical protein
MKMETTERPEIVQKPLTRHGKLAQQKVPLQSLQNSTTSSNLQPSNSGQIDTKEDAKMIENWTPSARRETLSCMAAAFIRPVSEHECIYLSSDDEN